MTVPLPSPPGAPADAHPPVRVPVRWLLDHASYPVRARTLLEFTRSTDLPKSVANWAYLHPLALQMSVVQRRDGTWPAGVLSLPGGNELSVDRVGTIPAVRRLVEYGWDPDSPPLALARRLLFRLLAEDVDRYVGQRVVGARLVGHDIDRGAAQQQLGEDERLSLIHI